MKKEEHLKKIYNILSSDETLIKRYDEIEKFEEEDKGYAYHNLEHAKNVDLLTEKILRTLNYDEKTIYKAKIASILHDVGSLEGKQGHAERGYVYSKNYFYENNIDFEGKTEVLDAILLHSDGFDSDNVITLTLILADKLDINKSRFSETGKTAIGNRQYTHINDIELNITDKNLIVNFITDGHIDIKEVNEYYFTEKIFRAIGSFANKLNLKHKILLDNKEWNLNIEKEII